MREGFAHGRRKKYSPNTHLYPSDTCIEERVFLFFFFLFMLVAYEHEPIVMPGELLRNLNVVTRDSISTSARTGVILNIITIRMEVLHEFWQRRSKCGSIKIHPPKRNLMAYLFVPFIFICMVGPASTATCGSCCFYPPLALRFPVGIRCGTREMCAHETWRTSYYSVLAMHTKNCV